MSAPPNTAAPCSGRLQPAAGAVCADKVANNLEWCSAAVLQTAHTNHHCMGYGVVARVATLLKMMTMTIMFIIAYIQHL